MEVGVLGILEPLGPLGPVESVKLSKTELHKGGETLHQELIYGVHTFACM